MSMHLRRFVMAAAKTVAVATVLSLFVATHMGSGAFAAEKPSAIAARLAALGASPDKPGFSPRATGQQLARGDECPTGSGSYCSDTTPKCCLIKGTYVCRKSLSACVED